MNRSATTDVCVIGGGPAGATIARQLAAVGIATCLIDRGGPTPGHVGVSLPPSLAPILDELGVRQRVEEAGFPRPSGAIVRWGAAGEAIYRPFPTPGFTVDRIRFDGLLSAAAQDAGATVIQPAVAARPQQLNDSTWRVPYRYGSSVAEVRCRFLVDAAGRVALLRRPRIRRSPRTIAVHGVWRNVRLNGIEPRIEAGESHWAWGVTLPAGTVLAAVFLDPAGLPKGGRHSLEATYRTLIQRTSLLRHCLAGDLVSPLRACDASPQVSTAGLDESYLKIGEAAICIDPLSSQGVQRAIIGAMQGAAVVNTMLRAPEHAGLAALFHCDRVHETEARDCATGAAYYREQAQACPTSFWRRHDRGSGDRQAATMAIRSDRPSPKQRLRLSNLARWQVVGALEGGVIVPRPALVHPALGRPVAYLAGRSVSDLMAAKPEVATSQEIRVAWQARLGEPASGDTLNWLWRHHILVDADMAATIGVATETQTSQPSAIG